MFLDEDEAKRIVKAIGYLPLAIDLAGTYLYELDMPLVKYLELVDKRHVLDRKLLKSGSQYDATAFSTLEISFEAVHQRDQKAAETLLMWGFLSNERIQVEMLYRGLGLDRNEHEGKLILF